VGNILSLVLGHFSGISLLILILPPAVRTIGQKSVGMSMFLSDELPNSFFLHAYNGKGDIPFLKKVT
jgi:hypothetical protein